MAEIQLSYGIRDGVPIHISAITPEFNGDRCGCVCPECKKPLQARAFGKKRTAYFAHKAASNCQPETILHWTAKYLLKKRILTAVTEQRELIAQWQCKSCHNQFQVDIAKEAVRVVVEKRLDSFIPDVVTYDVDDNPILLLEVVHSNHPSIDKLDYARSKNRNLIEFSVKDDNNLRSIETLEILPASNMTPCQSSFCGVMLVEAKPEENQSNTAGIDIAPTALPIDSRKTKESVTEGNAIVLPTWLNWLLWGTLAGVVTFQAFKSLRYKARKWTRLRR